MSVQVTILDGALPPPPPSPSPSETGASYPDGCGAWVRFEGIVRRIENERPIEALEYEAYEPMAQKTITRIAEELVRKHGLIAMTVLHSRGRVAVGECSFRLDVLSGHRKEALAAMDEFIDRLKKDVPIWKRAVWST